MSSISARLYYCGDEPLVLEPGDGAWIPVKASNEFDQRTGIVMTVQKLNCIKNGAEDDLDVLAYLTAIPAKMASV